MLLSLPTCQWDKSLMGMSFGYFGTDIGPVRRWNPENCTAAVWLTTGHRFFWASGNRLKSLLMPFFRVAFDSPLGAAGSPGLSQCVHIESWQIRVKKDKGDLSKFLPWSRPSELQLRIYRCVYMCLSISLLLSEQAKIFTGLMFHIPLICHWI